MKKFVFIFLIILFISGCTTGKVIYQKPIDKIEIEGPFLVTNVVDGDTLDLDDSRRVRFSGINTPETGECYYQEAKDKSKELLLGKEVLLEKDRSDEGKYGRALRYIYVDGFMVNKYLVENGYARVFDKYSYDTKRYAELKAVESIAKENNLGVWSCEDLKEGCLYVGSKDSSTYHLPDCKFAKKISPENLICYHSEEEVEDLEPCGTCLKN